MYHISSVANLITLLPNEPKCAADIGEPTIARVCAAPTLWGCKAAMEDMEPGVCYVYQIDTMPDISNVAVVNWEQGTVDDAKQTGEVWYLLPVPCRCVSEFVVEF